VFYIFVTHPHAANLLSALETTVRLLNLPSDKADLSHQTHNKASLTKVCGS